MDRSMNISAARIAEEAMTDNSLVYGVDLFDAVGKDLGAEYVHVPCYDRDHAYRLITALVEAAGCEVLDEVSRPHC